MILLGPLYYDWVMSSKSLLMYRFALYNSFFFFFLSEEIGLCL